jgi:hypothetical protein
VWAFAAYYTEKTALAGAGAFSGATMTDRGPGPGTHRTGSRLCPQQHRPAEAIVEAMPGEGSAGAGDSATSAMRGSNWRRWRRRAGACESERAVRAERGPSQRRRDASRRSAGGTRERATGSCRGRARPAAPVSTRVSRRRGSHLTNDRYLVALSPDGRQTGFSGAGPVRQVAVVDSPLQANEPRALVATEDARAPFWSADRRAIGFFSEGRMKRGRGWGRR